MKTCSDLSGDSTVILKYHGYRLSYLSIILLLVGHVYLALGGLTRFLFTHLPRNVVSYLCLLLGSGCLYRRGSHLIFLQPLVGGKSLY